MTTYNVLRRNKRKGTLSDLTCSQANPSIPPLRASGTTIGSSVRCCTLGTSLSSLFHLCTFSGFVDSVIRPRQTLQLPIPSIRSTPPSLLYLVALFIHPVTLSSRLAFLHTFQRVPSLLSPCYRRVTIVLTLPRVFVYSSVIAVNLLSTDEILRAGRSSLKPDGQQ